MTSRWRARLATLRWRLTLFYAALLLALLAAVGLFVYTRLEASLYDNARQLLGSQADLLLLSAKPLDGEPAGATLKLLYQRIVQAGSASGDLYVALYDPAGQALVSNQPADAPGKSITMSLDLPALAPPPNKQLVRVPGGGYFVETTLHSAVRVQSKEEMLTAVAAATPLPDEALALQKAGLDPAAPGTPDPATAGQKRVQVAPDSAGLFAAPVTVATADERALAYVLPIWTANPAVAQPDAYLVLATSLAAAARTLAELRLLLVIGLLGAGGVAVLLGLPLARLGLRPLERIAATAEGIGAGELSRRVTGAPPAPAVRDEVRQLALAFNAMLDRIEASFRAQQQSEARTRQFAADASHELRSPLTVLGGYLDVLGMGAKDDPAQVARIIAAMQRENARLSRLVVDLLLLTRMDARGAAGLRREPLALAEVVARAVDNLRLLAGARTLTLEIAPAARPACIHGDGDQLYRVLVNLLDNAIRHTADTGHIRVTLDPLPPAALRLTVADDGCGIAPADLPHIFDRFYRADPSRARQTGNAGLGLAIAKSIVEAHGGHIVVTSTPAAGTCFTVDLPLLAPVPQELTRIM